MERLTTTLLTGAAMSALSVAPAMAGHTGQQVPTRILPHGHSLGIAVKTPTGIRFLSGLHGKSNVDGLHGPVKTNYYTTYTFTTHDGFCSPTATSCAGSRTWDSTGAESTWFKVGKDLASAVAWETSGCTFISSATRSGYREYVYDCHLNNAPGSKAKASIKPAHGKLAAYTSPDVTAYSVTYPVYTYQCTTYSCHTGTKISYYEKERENINIVFDGPGYTLKSKTATHDSGQFEVSDKLQYTYTTTTTGTKHKHKKHTESFNGRIFTNLALNFTH